MNKQFCDRCDILLDTDGVKIPLILWKWDEDKYIKIGEFCEGCKKEFGLWKNRIKS